MTRSAQVKLTIIYLILCTLLQFILKAGEGKSLFRYGFMWLVLYSRMSFAISLFGKPTSNYMEVEGVGFGMSALLFFNMNVSDTFQFNFLNIALLVLIEVTVFALYQRKKRYVYTVERK